MDRTIATTAWRNTRSKAMNLIFIYGPPAAGKLTVARELVAITNTDVGPSRAAEQIADHFGLCRSEKT
jgi:AAA+ superfamily predicted ATPase